HYDLAKNEVNLKADSEASLPDLLKPFPVPELKAAKGKIRSAATFTQNGRQSAASGQLQLIDFTGGYGDYALTNFQASADYSGEIVGNDVHVQRANVTFGQNSQPVGGAELSGRYHLTNHAAQISFKLSELNQQLLRPFLASALGEMQLVSMTLNGQGTASYDPKRESALKAEFTIANWAVKDAQARLPATAVNGRIQVDAALRQPEIDIKQLVIDFKQGAASAGLVDLNGRFNLTNFSGSGAFKISDFNQTILGPLLASSLGENKLVSIAVNGSGTVNVDPKGDSAMKAELKVANLVVEDPQKKSPRTPLSAEVQLDGSNRKQVFDLRQLALKLSPTQRAQNQLQLKGRLNLSPSNATPSQLALEADSMDLTPYYDLFAGQTSTNQPGPHSSAVPTGEPPPVSLPLQQLTADLRIGRCYLRDVALTNVQGTAKINRGEVTLQPLQFALNGAPVSAKAVLDLSVPGYKYDITFKADKMPLGPLASSFGGKSGSTLQGVLLADAQLKGAGVSGANLQKNLSGQVALSLTNLNFEIVGKKVKALLEPIALVLRVPELTLTPLEWVNARADVGQGKVNVSEFSVFSQAFYANGQGVVQLAPVLSNSIPNIPVSLALRRSLAEKARLVPRGTPTNAAYVQLPTFAKLGGTLGEPKTEIDKLVISGLLLQSASGIPKVSEKTGNLLQGLGGILSGQRPGVVNTNLPAGTNSNQAVQTNKPAKFNPLDLLELIPKKK
ncbi:MAG: AsmA family protein, partial [Verrucomicrobia bacterium]|nr:AsmA family protein [Verrucomicrobiota bacterium]